MKADVAVLDGVCHGELIGIELELIACVEAAALAYLALTDSLIVSLPDR
jgi:hypothetical protein